MQELKVRCPCCGRHFILSVIVDSPIVEAEDQKEVARIASDFGIELGCMKGGEKTGN